MQRSISSQTPTLSSALKSLKGFSGFAQGLKMLPVSLSAIGEDSRLSCEAGRRNWQTWQTHALGLHHRFSSLKLLKHVVSVVAVAILVELRCEQLAGEGQKENAWSTARSVQICCSFPGWRARPTLG